MYNVRSNAREDTHKRYKFEDLRETESDGVYYIIGRRDILYG